MRLTSRPYRMIAALVPQNASLSLGITILAAALYAGTRVLLRPSLQTASTGALLAEAGFPSDLAPPMLLVGRGTMVSTLDVQRLVIPLQTEVGQVEVQVALRENAASAARRSA